jgi:hypothetical protein
MLFSSYFLETAHKFLTQPGTGIPYTFSGSPARYPQIAGACIEHQIPMPKTENIVLHSSLAPDECIRRIQASTDPGDRAIFSLSGYKGSKPLLVKLDGNRFVLWKRRYYRNDFAPYLFGTLSQDNQGTRLEGHFDMNRWVKIFMKIWIAFAVLTSLPVLFATLNGPVRENAWVGVAVPIGLIAFGIILPKFGRWLGKNEEKFMTEFLETTLAAQPAESRFIVSQRVIENTPL